MSDTYTKLFRSITASTIVSEPLATRWLWVTMLSQADSTGCVWASVPGLARLANITMAECEAALECFYNPDPYSRTQDNEGRRIEAIDGGWRLLNHAKYDAIRSAEERANYKRQWDRDNRPSGGKRAKQSDSPTTSPTDSDSSPTKPDSPTASLSSQFSPPKARAAARRAALCNRFDEFWNAYPVHKAEDKAAAAWKRVPPDLVDTILAKIAVQREQDADWLQGFVPHPATYLNGKRWNDDIAKPKPTTTGSPPSRQPVETYRPMPKPKPTTKTFTELMGDAAAAVGVRQ